MYDDGWMVMNHIIRDGLSPIVHHHPTIIVDDFVVVCQRYYILPQSQRFKIAQFDLVIPLKNLLLQRIVLTLNSRMQANIP